MKTLKDGESAPYGLHRRERQEWFVFLRIPLFPWYGTAYDGVNDQKVVGWHMKDAYIRIALGDVTLKEVQRISWRL